MRATKQKKQERKRKILLLVLINLTLLEGLVETLEVIAEFLVMLVVRAAQLGMDQDYLAV
ncbi:hypothetical protein D3C76_190830 [compost metagenome]